MEYTNSFGVLLFLVVAISSVHMQDQCTQLKSTVSSKCSAETRDLSINCNQAPPSGVAKCIDEALRTLPCTDEHVKSMIQAKKAMYEVYCENRDVLQRDTQCKQMALPSFSNSIFNAMEQPSVDCKKIHSDREMDMKKSTSECNKVLESIMQKFVNSAFCASASSNMKGGNSAAATHATAVGVFFATLALLALVKIF